MLTAALRELDARGVELSDIGLRRPTLDDVFLTLTGHRAAGSDVGRDGDRDVGARPGADHGHERGVSAPARQNMQVKVAGNSRSSGGSYVPAAVHSLALHSLTKGSRGGSQQIADALVAVLEKLGGRVECDRRIESLAELQTADAVLLDLTPRQVLAIAGDDHACKSSTLPAPWSNAGFSGNPASMDALAKNRSWIKEKAFIKCSFPLGKLG